MYTMDNVVISGTHTHGTPGGYMMDLLYDMSTFGFVSESYYAMVDGIYNVRSVPLRNIFVINKIIFL